MYASLGNIVFEGLSGFTSFVTTRESNIQQISRLQNKPTLQQIGVKAQKISFALRLGASFTDVETDIDRLSAALNQAEILSLTTGQGRFLGDFVIKKISENQLHTTKNGQLLWCDLQIELLEQFNNNVTEQKDEQAQQNGFAQAFNSPNLFEEIEDLSNPTSAAAKNLNESLAKNRKTSEDISEIEKNPSLLKSKSESIKKDSESQKQNANQLDFLLEQADTAQNLYGQLRSTVRSSVTLYDALKRAAFNNDLQSMLTLKTDLELLNSSLENQNKVLNQRKILRL